MEEQTPFLRCDDDDDDDNEDFSDTNISYCKNSNNDYNYDTDLLLQREIALSPKRKAFRLG